MDTSAVAYKVTGFLGRAEDATLLSLAEEHVPIVVAFIRAYVRGNGFSEAGTPNADLESVIITATARLVTNPTLVRNSSAGPFNQTPGQLNGFTLPELAILHLYRRRTA